MWNFRYSGLGLFMAIFVAACGTEGFQAGKESGAAAGGFPAFSGDGKGQFAFVAPLAEASNAEKTVALRFELEDGGSMVVKTFASEKALMGGLNISFVREGNELTTSFVYCCGGEISKLPTPQVFDASKQVSMYMSFDNETARVQIWKVEGDAKRLALDSQGPEVKLDDKPDVGKGRHWGVRLERGTLYEARIL
jgi:hypothetical protein